MTQSNLTKDGYRQAQAITKKYATTFYFASHFLSKEKRLAAYAIYAICRLTDESVDSPSPLTANELQNTAKRISDAYSQSNSADPICLAFRETIHKYKIPKEYFDELIAGMYMDLDKNRYSNFNELYQYCYRVAGVVGLIMLHIFGFKDQRAKNYAINLGIAMQLTNILRDIKEDLLRGRIYLPHDEMLAYGISEMQFSEGTIDDTWKAFMQFQIGRAKKYYAQSSEGINLITDRKSRFVTRAMKEIYAGILDKIIKNHYDCLNKRAYVSILGKVIIILKIILKNK